MAGIYLHIPFCKTRCIYCDFYSSTQSELKEGYIRALCRELKTRKDYLQDEPIETIYFGGGTPSQLEPADLRRIFETIRQTYGMEHCREITLEANPDDLTPEYVESLAALPFNRLSLGIQTFNDEVLKLLRRRHNAEQAILAVRNARQRGFRNISIDLIYGLPGQTPESWQHDLSQAIALEVEHISAYHLTYEEGTPIYTMLARNQVTEVSEDNSLHFFTELTRQLSEAGYEHYEISNFSRPGKHSLHNSSYWKGVSYLGCGASAHSFNGTSREWNVASIDQYIEGINLSNRQAEVEELDQATRYNDLVITGIRTKWGLSLTQVERYFGILYVNHALENARRYIASNDLVLEDNHLKLTPKGIFISDGIMSDLLYVDPHV